MIIEAALSTGYQVHVNILKTMPEIAGPLQFLKTDIYLNQPHFNLDSTLTSKRILCPT